MNTRPESVWPLRGHSVPAAGQYNTQEAEI